MQQQIETMLELQNAINTRTHADWRTQGFEWYRAIWVECAELMDHFGWKWWKKQSRDTQQVKLELIDIWHFGLSLLLEEETDIAIIQEQLNRGLSAPAQMDFRNNVEMLASFVLENESFNLEYFGQLMRAIDLDFNELYTTYVGKNVLNFFRQDNGYQEGSYQKIWDGREDNEHLIELVDILDATAEDFKDQLYHALKARYTDRTH